VCSRQYKYVRIILQVFNVIAINKIPQCSSTLESLILFLMAHNTQWMLFIYNIRFTTHYYINLKNIIVVKPRTLALQINTKLERQITNWALLINLYIAYITWEK
jgi:hypothetical protein